jgi:hypothetical protein
MEVSMRPRLRLVHSQRAAGHHGELARNRIIGNTSVAGTLNSGVPLVPVSRRTCDPEPVKSNAVVHRCRGVAVGRSFHGDHVEIAAVFQTRSQKLKFAQGLELVTMPPVPERHRNRVSSEPSSSNERLEWPWGTVNFQTVAGKAKANSSCASANSIWLNIAVEHRNECPTDITLRWVYIACGSKLRGRCFSRASVSRGNGRRRDSLRRRSCYPDWLTVGSGTGVPPLLVTSIVLGVGSTID